MAHHPLVIHPEPPAPRPHPPGRGAGLRQEQHMQTVIGITAIVAGVTGIALAAWHGWKARRR